MARTPLFRWLKRQSRQAMSQNRDRMSRRDFLKFSAAMAGTFAGSMATMQLGPVLAAVERSGARLQTAEPVLIVGAGLAGLTAAYRLSRQGIACEIFEAGNRIGGRVFTRENFTRDHQFVELGGELIDTGHAELIGLCRELNVPLEAFAPGDADVLPALYVSQGRIRTEAEVLQAFKPLANSLQADILRCFPDGEISIPTYKVPYQAAWLDHLSLKEYLYSKNEVAPWLLTLIEKAYVGEYGLDADQQSALNLLLMLQPSCGPHFEMFGDSDEAMRIQGGNSRVVDALAAAIKEDVPAAMSHELIGIHDQGKQLVLTFKNGQKHVTRKAEKVILALPFSILRNVEGIGKLHLSDVKQQCIRELGYGTNSKLMLVFKSRFWRRPGAAPASSGTIYTDLNSQAYWETSRLQPGESGVLTNFLGGRAGEWATESQVQGTLQDLSEIYPNVSDQFDGRAVLMNWVRSPYVHGSYSCPKPGQYTRLIGSAGEPELNERLFFAGEHCSIEFMGYMNGAVQSGNVVATQLVSSLKTASATAK